ncbi:MAG TPA: carbohydrate kinase family protein [Dehalococcoidia bacterium]|nr:carbohydrate kinase family protein [Dehalococcoidia bacterium]
MGKIKVIGLGAMNTDLIYLVERIVSDGETTAKKFCTAPGGSAANTTYGLAKLGVDTGFIGAVGDDEAGRMLLGDFESAGVESTRVTIKPKAETGSALCITDRAGRRTLYVSPGANSLLNARDVDLKYLKQAEFVHLSSFIDLKQFHIQQRLISELPPSVKVSLAPGELYAAKGLGTLAPMLGKTYVLFLNQHELKQLTGQGLEKGAQRCLERGCKTVAITLGKGITRQGKTMACYLIDGEEGCFIEAEPVVKQRLLETTGAGDAFAAGVLYGLLTGKGLRECGVLGEIMAQFCIRKIGARAGLPLLAELAQQYQDRTGSLL